MLQYAHTQEAAALAGGSLRDDTDLFNQWQAGRGHNYIGRNYVGHNYIGHKYIGHTYIGHNYVGHNSITCSISGRQVVAITT